MFKCNKLYYHLYCTVSNKFTKQPLIYTLIQVYIFNDVEMSINDSYNL